MTERVETPADVLAFRSVKPGAGREGERGGAAPFAELAAATNFSFLRGASKAQDMVLTALLQGSAGLGIADRNTLAGVVRAWAALEQLREDGLPLPEKVREGGSPGDHAWIEHPEAQRFLACQEEVKARAKAFKLAVGASLVFSDGAPEILAY